MTVYHLKPEDPTADYYDIKAGQSIEDKIKKVRDWDDLDADIQEAQIAKWTALAGNETVVEPTIENIAKLSEFAKGLRSRLSATDDARQALVREFLASVKDLEKKDFPTSKNQKDRIDAVAAVQEAVKTSFANIAGWIKDEKVKKIFRDRQSATAK